MFTLSEKIVESQTPTKPLNILNDNIKVLVFTAYTMWAQALTKSFETFTRNISAKFVIIEGNNWESSIDVALMTNSNITLVSSPRFFGGDISFAHNLRATGYQTPLMLICSQFSLPCLEDLIKTKIDGIVPTSASLQELEGAIYEVIDNQPDALRYQYKRAMRFLSSQISPDRLGDHEKEILQLVAADLKDQEIAERLGVNVRTINNQLRLIYAKLGVRGRAGAINSALVKGLINPRLQTSWLI